MSDDVTTLSRAEYINKYWDKWKVYRKSPAFIKQQLKNEVGIIWDKFNTKKEGE